MKRFLPIGVLLIFALAMLVYGIHVFENREEAKKAVPVRANLTIYSDLPNNLTTVLANQYETENHVKVTILPLTEEQLRKRLQLSEADQNGDLVLTNQENLEVGAHKGVFAPVLLEGTDEILDRFKDKDYLWVGLWYDPVIIAQGDDFYKREGKFITTWRSLALPGDWQVVITDFVASQAAANILYSFVEINGEENGINYFVKLKPHVMQYAKFLVTPIRLAALGETNIGIGNYSDGKQYESHHYPVKIIFPADGTPYYLTGIGMLKSTSNTKESEAFISWLLRKETAQLLESNNFHYIYTNPEVPKPLDSLSREVVLLDTQGHYTEEGKKVLLDKWITQVRFRKDT